MTCKHSVCLRIHPSFHSKPQAHPKSLSQLGLCSPWTSLCCLPLPPPTPADLDRARVLVGGQQRQHEPLASLALPPLLGAGSRGLPVNRVRLGRGVLVLLPDLDRLVGLARDQARAGLVKGHGVDAGLRLERARLHNRLLGVEVVPGLPVEELHVPVVLAGHEHVVVVDRDRVDDGPRTVDVLHEGALRTLPLLDIVGGRGREEVLARVERHRAHALLVVRERRVRLAGRKIPQLDRAVVRARDDLRVRRLRAQRPDRVLVPRETVDLLLATNVPHAHR
eukprot:2754095-Rhodomonas_salina.4